VFRTVAFVPGVVVGGGVVGGGVVGGGVVSGVDVRRAADDDGPPDGAQHGPGGGVGTSATGGYSFKPTLPSCPRSVGVRGRPLIRPVDRNSAVRPLGFEPRTNGLRVHCSAIELEARVGPAVYGDEDVSDLDSATTGPFGVSEGT
jgi:hypothetical protein